MTPTTSTPSEAVTSDAVGESRHAKAMICALGLREFEDMEGVLRHIGSQLIQGDY